MPLSAGLGCGAARTSIRQSVRISSKPQIDSVQTSRVTAGTSFASGATACSACAAQPTIATVAARRACLTIAIPLIFGVARPLTLARGGARVKRPAFPARIRGFALSVLPVLERHAKQLEPVADQPEPKLARHGLLQLLDLLVRELDDLSRLDVDEMVVVAMPG